MFQICLNLLDLHHLKRVLDANLPVLQNCDKMICCNAQKLPMAVARLPARLQHREFAFSLFLCSIYMRIKLGHTQKISNISGPCWRLCKDTFLSYLFKYSDCHIIQRSSDTSWPDWYCLTKSGTQPMQPSGGAYLWISGFPFTSCGVKDSLLFLFLQIPLEHLLWQPRFL